MRLRSAVVVLVGIFAALLALHASVLRLPYFWDEAGYYIPAAYDFYRRGRLIPVSTLPTGHTPLLMVYLALLWKLFGFSTLVTRSGMILVAAATVFATLALGQRVTRREAAMEAALLLALSPLFFAQSSLAQLDLPAALFTTLAIYELLVGGWGGFAVAASLAVMTKETAVIFLLPAALYAWRRHEFARRRVWMSLLTPLAPLLLWTAYYHHYTGFWTGNASYLQYNLYSTLTPAHIFTGFLRRLYEILIAGFNWVLWLGAFAGIKWGRSPRDKIESDPLRGRQEGDFFFLTFSFAATSVVFHSVIGGAVLSRYLLPVFPALYLALVIWINRLPRAAARSVVVGVAVLFVAAWFINPPYPFPYEDNLAYSEFIRLHQQAARFLARQTGRPRILTAWPATDELSHPILGYINQPLRVVRIRGFSPADFQSVSPDSFDLLYLYSRQWNPPRNWLSHAPFFRRKIQKLFNYVPTVSGKNLAARYHLHRIAIFRDRGQWVKIYAK